MTPLAVLATIFFSFVAGTCSLLAAFLLYLLLNKISAYWYKHTGEQIPAYLFKRGLMLSIWPVAFTLFASIRIFLALNAVAVSEIFVLMMFGVYGIYCTLVSAFVFALFQAMSTMPRKPG